MRVILNGGGISMITKELERNKYYIKLEKKLIKQSQITDIL